MSVIVYSPQKPMNQHKTVAIVRRQQNAITKRCSMSNWQICIDISFKLSSPHILLPLMSYRAIKLPVWCRGKNTCSFKLSLYKVTGLDLLSHKIKALGIMKLN